MNTPELLNGMVSELVRRGLPSEYAQRAAAEFADHHRDLVEELQASGWSESQAITEASQRLGNSRTLIKRTVQEYQRRYWCGRWPKLAFLFLPIPTMYAFWIATTLFVQGGIILLDRMGIVHLAEATEGPLSASQRAILFAAVSCFLLVLPALVTLAFVRLAKRARLDGRWIVLVACMLALCVGSVRFYQGPRYKSAADAVAGINPTSAYWLDVLPFGNAAFWSHPARSLYRTYTVGVFQPYQTLLPLAVAAIAVLWTRQLARRSPRPVADAC